MIIDWEHHYLPEDLWVKKGGKLGERTVFFERGKPRGNLHPELYDIEAHIKMMDCAGIDMAVLSMSVSNDNTQIALEECRVWVDKAAEVVRKHPARFAALAPVPPLGGEEALAELERAVSSKGMKGAVIRSQVEGLNLDSKELYPFYKKLSELKVPLFIHPSGVQVGFDALNAPYDLYRSIGREFDLMAATTRLILSGVLEDFPDLTLVISHKGGGIAALKERIVYWFGDPGEGGTRTKKHFDEYFKRIYFNLAGHHGGMASVKCALTSISPDRLLFGTDWPHEFFGEDPVLIKDFVENIKKLDLEEESKNLMLGGNAKTLLGL